MPLVCVQNELDGCALRRRGNPAIRDQLSRLAAPTPGLNVVLAAGTPIDNPEDATEIGTAGHGPSISELDWSAAITATVAAVIERGGVVTLPANPIVAQMVALSAFPYRARRGTSDQPISAVRVVETAGQSDMNRHLLAPFVRAGVIDYYKHLNDRPLPTTLFAGPGGRDAASLRDAIHHPLTEDLLGDATGVVIIDLNGSLADDAEMVVRNSTVEDRFLRIGPHREPHHGPSLPLEWIELLGVQHMGEALPYDYIMEAVVETWMRPRAVFLQQ